jgi:hypothetical protein
MTAATPSSPGFLPTAVRKGTVFTSAFALAGVAACALIAPRSPVLAPHGVLYALILLNTFPSIRIFASIQDPRDAFQNGVDIALGFSYVALVLSLGRPWAFPAATVLMFSLATAKYMHLRGRTAHPRLVRRKTVVDILGAVGAGAAMVASAFWEPSLIHWLWAAGFALAQVHIFLVRPLYVFHSPCA